MSVAIEIVHAAPNLEGGAPTRHAGTPRTVEQAMRAADTEVAMIGVPGAVTYCILDASGQPVSLGGGTMS